MYLNFNVYPEQLLPCDLYYLLAIKLVKTDIDIPEDVLSRFETLNLVKYIKGAIKEEERLKLRLSDKGKDLLKELEEPEVLEEDVVVYNWLRDFYTKSGKDIGNGAKTKRHIRDFRIKSGISKNSLVFLCTTFLKDENNMMYNQKLEYAFYKPPTAFETRFNLEESRIWNYYKKHIEYFTNKFKELDGGENC